MVVVCRIHGEDGALTSQRMREYETVAVATRVAGLCSPFSHRVRRGGLDYRHGTGHGVGSFLNVHEGPEVRALWLHYSLGIGYDVWLPAERPYFAKHLLPGSV